MHPTTIAIDLAKSVFQIAISHRPGRVAHRCRLRRHRLMEFMAKQPPATVVMEACGSSNYWGQRFQGIGHSVVLLPAQYVKNYVRRNKTDRADADALLEAFRCEDLHSVPVKSPALQALASIHRFRSAWKGTRTARINVVRGLLREFGITIPLGAGKVLPAVQLLLEDADSGMPDSLRELFHQACCEIRELDERIKISERQLAALAKTMPIVAQLRTIPGVGLLTATALVALVADPHRFANGRRFASYLGLTPSERSSAFRRILGKISKFGDPYLRTLLVHGARSVLNAATRRKENDRLRVWALEVHARRGYNKATVALANKLARIAWAVWKNDTRYESRMVAA